MRNVSSWEANARRAKINALYLAFDREFGPLSPEQCRRLAEALPRWTARDWKVFAKERAHCNAPTFRQGRSLTVEGLIDVLLDKAAGRPVAEPTPPDFSDLRGPGDVEDEVLEALAQEAADHDAADVDDGDQTDAERRADMLGPSVPSWSMR